VQKYQTSITTTNGNVVPNAIVTVTIYGTNVPAILYSGNGTGLLPSNVLVTDSQGEFFFYAANGRYSYTVAASNYVSEAYTDFILFDPADYNGGSGGGGSVNTDGYWVTPEQFGAVGDGQTDDGPAFTAAYAAAFNLALTSYNGNAVVPYSSPVSIICKPGSVYRIRTSIIVQSFTAMRGNGSTFVGPIDNYPTIAFYAIPTVPASSDVQGQTGGACFTDELYIPFNANASKNNLLFEEVQASGFRYGICARQVWAQCVFRNVSFNCNVGIFSYTQFTENKFHNVACPGGQNTFIGSATCFASDNPFAVLDNYTADGMYISQDDGYQWDGCNSDAGFDTWFRDAVLRPNTLSYTYYGISSTASISGVTLTLSAPNAGVAIGQLVVTGYGNPSGTTQVAANTFITGGSGLTWTVSVSQNAPSQSMNFSEGVNPNGYGWPWRYDTEVCAPSGRIFYCPNRNLRNIFSIQVDKYFHTGSPRGFGIFGLLTTSSFKNIGGEILFANGPYPMILLLMYGATLTQCVFENINAIEVTNPSSAAIECRPGFGAVAGQSSYSNGSFIARDIRGKIIGVEQFTEYQPDLDSVSWGLHLGAATVDDPTRIVSSAVAFHASSYTYYYRVRSNSTNINRINLQVGTSSGNIAIAVYRGNASTSNPARYPNGYTSEEYVPSYRIFTTGVIPCPAAGYNVLNTNTYLNIGYIGIREGDWIAIACDNVTATFAAFQATEVSGIDENFYAGRCGYEAVFPPPQVPTMTAGLKRGIYVSTNLGF
jgi:hypothetical protein